MDVSFLALWYFCIQYPIPWKTDYWVLGLTAVAWGYPNLTITDTSSCIGSFHLFDAKVRNGKSSQIVLADGLPEGECTQSTGSSVHGWSPFDDKSRRPGRIAHSCGFNGIPGRLPFLISKEGC